MSFDTKIKILGNLNFSIVSQSVAAISFCVSTFIRYGLLYKCL